MKKLVLILTLLSASAAFAGECVIVTDRVPCAGKEAEARKPYITADNPTGNPTTDTKKVGSADACKVEAEKGCAIVRKGTLKSKAIKATFGDTKFENVCDPKRPDYNQC